MTKKIDEIKKIQQKELDTKIETVREVLYKKIEENIDKKEIQQISEELDVLIVEYFRK